MGEETYRALEAALQTEPPVSIRVNRTKWSGEVAGEPVLWASAGVYLSQRPTFTFDPLFHAGCYYVQMIDVQLRTSEHRSMYSYVRLSIIDVQLRTSEHDRCTARTSDIDRCTANVV